MLHPSHGSGPLHLSSTFPLILSVLRLLLTVRCPLHLVTYLRILTEIFSDYRSGSLAREFGFINHDAPPIEKEASDLSVQGRWFPPLFKGHNRLEPQSRTNRTLARARLMKGSHRGATELQRGWTGGRGKDNTVTSLLQHKELFYTSSLSHRNMGITT